MGGTYYHKSDNNFNYGSSGSGGATADSVELFSNLVGVVIWLWVSYHGIRIMHYDWPLLSSSG